MDLLNSDIVCPVHQYKLVLRTVSMADYKQSIFLDNIHSGYLNPNRTFGRKCIKTEERIERNYECPEGCLFTSKIKSVDIIETHKCEEI